MQALGSPPSGPNQAGPPTELLLQSPKYALLRRFQHMWHSVHGNTNRIQAKANQAHKTLEALSSTVEKSVAAVHQLDHQVQEIDAAGDTLFCLPAQIQEIQDMIGNVEALLDKIHVETVKRDVIQFGFEQQAQLVAHTNQLREGTSFYEEYLKKEYQAHLSELKAKKEEDLRVALMKAELDRLEKQQHLQASFEADLLAYKQHGIVRKPVDPSESQTSLETFTPEADALLKFLNEDAPASPKGADPTSPDSKPPEVAAVIDEVDEEARAQPTLPDPAALTQNTKKAETEGAQAEKQEGKGGEETEGEDVKQDEGSEQ
eukprot:TRINITY_DN58207_c0_g1_i1.p1 TRINITY_DN58207_c0_g1~~TRINITY_DN58207_c0_g1_i1.p1  ORF type:complete len:317 (-),score=54.43 TRINITY_DN58207_c0_g1_i1:37-987(-)